MNLKNTVSLTALAVLVATGATFAQVKKKTAATAKPKPAAATTRQVKTPSLSVERLPVDPNLLTGKLPNGLTYYIRNTAAGSKAAQLVLVNKAGSLIETDAQRGYAHLINHLAFAGTRDFSQSDMAALLKQAGLSAVADSNAYTNYEETAYQLVARTDTLNMFERSLKLMANWAGGVTFDAAAVTKEQTAILKEITEGGKTPKERLQLQTLPVLLNNSRYAQRQPVGTEAAIKAATAADLKAFYTDWYRPDLQAIIVVGDVDAQDVLKKITENFGGLRGPAVVKPLAAYTVAPAAGTVIKTATDKQLPYSLVEVVVKRPEMILRNPSDMLQTIRVRLFNQMIANRIDEVAQTSNAPILFGQASYSNFIGRQDAFSALAVANNNGLEVAVKTIFSELERVRKLGFLSEELETAKQNALTQISNEYSRRQYESPFKLSAAYKRNFLSGYAIPGIDYEYNYYISEISKITMADMNAFAARLLTDQNRVILVEGPEAEKTKLPTDATLLQWVAEAGKNVTPYENLSAVPLMTTGPVAGKVVDTKVDSTLLVTNLTLSNGVKVILKPTKFQSNQILINAYAFGGTSLASDADFPSANMAAGVVTSSGVAGFSQIQLEKMLRGRSLSISPYIGDVTQGLSGYASAADFETAMQLIHLYFTQPRKDVEVWNRTVAQTKGVLVTRATDPYNLYQDTVAAVLSGYNPRGMTTTLAQVNTANLDKAYAFYKDRFADAGNFTFTFTGAFAVEDIIPFLEVYLGSLPSTNKKETYKNLGIHPVPGQVTKIVQKGAGTESAVQLVYSGAYTYNETNNLQMDALEEVLNLRLGIKFDEKSGVVNPGARVSYLKFPEGQYKVTLSFTCAPADVDKLTAAVLDEVNKMKQAGPEQKEVNTFVINEAKSVQSQLRQNTYWSILLSAAAQNGDDPDRILSRVAMLEKINIATVKEAANKYLSGTNLIKLIFTPEKK